MNQKLDFIGIGPQKTGSTWLHNMLIQHPEICLPSISKEIELFSLKYNADLSFYDECFGDCDAVKCRGEFTPAYFDDPVVIERIHQHFPKVKLVVGIRNPIDKALSLFRHYYRHGKVKSKDFSKAVKEEPQILESGKYASYLKRWCERFPANQIIIYDYDMIVSAPDTLLNQLCSFLEISEYDFADTDSVYNAASTPRSWLLAKIGRKAAEIARKHNLFSMIDFLKKRGLHHLFYSGGSEPLQLRADDKTFLREYYSQEQEQLDEMNIRKIYFP
ncbi:MAG: sulfotransferase [Cyclobacteriaceae bacterium]